MSTLNQIFSISNRVICVVEHPMIKRANLGFTLQQPFAWSLINTAAVAVRMLDEAVTETITEIDENGRRQTQSVNRGFTAQSLESEPVRKAILESDFNIERFDQLVVKMATLRHFNRLSCGSNEIGMGTINACLKPDATAIDLEAIKQSARDRIKIERRMGKLKATQVTHRFNELVTSMYKTESDRKAQAKRLMNEVFYLCNRSDDMLFLGNYEQQIKPHTAYRDAELADFDQFDYLGENLAEKCVEPVIRARDEVQKLMDRSYRSTILGEGSKLLKELDKLAVELGINFAKIDAENAKIDAEIAQAEAEEADMDAEIDELDIDLGACVEAAPEQLVTHQRRTVKSEARLKREAEETEAAEQRAEYEAACATKTAKAKATREANKAKQAA